MSFRRIVGSLVLVLFAFLTIGLVVGLPEAARIELASRLPGADGTVASPSPTPTPSPVRPTVRPTPSVAPSVTPTPSATPRPTVAPKSTATPKPVPSIRPTAKPKPLPAKPTSTKPPTTAPKKSKQQASRYLTGPLKKGAGGTVYLTFDDGPSPYTASILAALERTGSTATFFHLGMNEGDYPHADARIRAQGSKVANHSYNHPDLTKLTAAQVKWQLRHGPKAKCFRPPYGAADAAVRKAIANAGMREVRWTLDTFDWTRPGVPKLAKTGRLKAVRDGSIVLMHDGGGDRTQTVAALPTIIDDLHARGFKVRALPYC